MPGVLSVLALLALAAVGWSLVWFQGRRRRDPWRLMRDLGPVSGNWLSDFRRTG